MYIASAGWQASLDSLLTVFYVVGLDQAGLIRSVLLRVEPVLILTLSLTLDIVGEAAERRHFI